MTYNICYKPKGSEKEYVMFDIDYYMNFFDEENKLWNSEVHCWTSVEGLTHFLKDKENTGFDYDNFIKKAKEIQELRMILHEHFNNKPTNYEDAKYFNYYIFKPVLDQKLREFTMVYTDCRIKID